MKKIEAIIRREKFFAVDAALKSIGVGGLTVEQVEGRGRLKLLVSTRSWGVWTHEEEYMRHAKLEIVVKDEDAQKVIDAIVTSATTGSAGDGKIFVSTVDSALDIGLNAAGDKAIDVEKMAPVTVKAVTPRS